MYCDTAPAPSAPSVATQTTDSQASFCTHCGASLTGGNFCPSCGAQAIAPPPPQNDGWNTAPVSNSAYLPPQPPLNGESPFTAQYLGALQQNPQAMKHKMPAWLIVVIVVVVLIRGLLSFLSYRSWSDQMRYILDGRPSSIFDDRNYGGNDFWDDEDFYSYFDDSSKDDAKEDLVTNLLPTAPDSAIDSGMPLYENGISLEEYRQLKLQMNYAEVSALIGGDGIAMPADDETASQDSVQLVWVGEYTEGALVTMTFENQKLMQVQQEGLF